MKDKPNWWERLKIKWMLGDPFMPEEDLGRVDETVIRYKDKLISVLEDPDTGEIKSLGWFPDTELHTNTPIKEFWTARQEKL